ncbi:MAG: diguanylate cyclase, partial [Nitrospinae bacterium]|nr:diguanylate cyclase [Nitrospinota bacterium]
MKAPDTKNILPPASEERPLRWWRTLAFKVTAVGVIFIALTAGSLTWLFSFMREELVFSERDKARALAEGAQAAIMTFVLETEQGGALIPELLKRINESGVGARAQVRHSEAVNRQYPALDSELPQSESERLSLADGEERYVETEGAFTFIAPVRSVEGCAACHQLADGSPIPAGTVMGLLVMDVSKDRMNESLRSFNYLALSTVGAVSGLAALLALYIGLGVTRPVSRMYKVIRRATRGERGLRVPVTRDDEIGRLSGAFNVMAGAVEDSMTRLENWNEELREEVERQTRRAQEMYDYTSAVIDSTRRVIITTDNNLVVDFVNAEWTPLAALHGVSLTRADMIGKSAETLLPPRARQEYERLMRDTLVRSVPLQRDFDFPLPNGETRYYSVGVSTLSAPDGKALGLIIIITDISARIRADAAVRAERNKLSAIMNGMGDAVLIVDTYRRINFANRLMETTFGGDQMEGKRCYEVIGRQISPCPGCMVEAGESFSVEICGANQRYYMVTHSPIMDAGGKRYMVGVYKDITFRKGMEEELRNLTVTDTLTGLYNKRSFNERIRDEVARAGRMNTPLSLVFADIDKFKKLNDTHGHLTGDDCLRALGEIIRESIRDRVDTGFR